jgi:hypothetical protein
MSDSEYTLVQSAVSSELRAYAGMSVVWLMLCLKIALTAWLLLATTWLCSRVADLRRARFVSQFPRTAGYRKLTFLHRPRIVREKAKPSEQHALVIEKE